MILFDPNWSNLEDCPVFSVFDALKENEKEIEDLNHLLNDQYKLRESENKQHQDKLTQLTVGYFNFIIKST